MDTIFHWLNLISMVIIPCSASHAAHHSFGRLHVVVFSSSLILCALNDTETIIIDH